MYRRKPYLPSPIQGMAEMMLVTLACLMFAMAAGLARASIALGAADEGTDDIVMYQDHPVSKDENNDFNYMVDPATGRILYCISFGAEQPYDGDHLVYGGRLADVDESTKTMPFSGARPDNVHVRSDFKEMLRAFDYLAYHGYTGDTSINLGGITGDRDKLYLTTQLALYYVMGSKVGSNEHIEDSSITDEIKAAATALYDEAMVYACDTSGTARIEDNTAIWYYDKDDADCQNILTCAAKGRIHIKKESSDPGISAQDTGYSLAGAEFTVSRTDSPDTVLARIVTDEQGEGISAELSHGSYLLTEVKAPQGFSKASDPIAVEITGGPRFVTVNETPLYALAGTLLTKVDDETSKNTPLGAASLAGAQFLVSYYAGTYTKENLPETPTRSWTLETDDQGALILDADHLMGSENSELYTNKDGQVGIPLGTLAVKELKAPAGYLLPNDPLWVSTVDDSTSGQTLTLGQDGTVSEPAIRGDISFGKVEEGTGKALSHVLFRVTSDTTHESHLIMTDADGNFSSTAHSHADRTNALDAAMKADGTIDETTLDETYGTWFYGYQPEDGNHPAPDDTRGAFPYDSYTFQELATSATTGHELISFSVTIADDGKTVDLGKKGDTEVTIRTVAHDAADNDKYLAPSGQQTIVDTVSYQGLNPGATYVLTGTLVDPSDGSTLKDSSGNPYQTSASFTPTDSTSSYDLSIRCDTADFDTSRIVVCERLERDGSLIARHEELTDADQTLYIPRIKTTLTDTTDGDHVIPSNSTCTLTDTVTYEGLVPGETYQLEGSLMDRQTAKALTDDDGTPLATTVTIIPTASDGEAEVSFTLDTEGLGQHDLVAFETLHQGNTTICTHTDLNDAAQTVTVEPSPLLLPSTGSKALVLVTSFGLLSLATGCLGHLRLWH